MTVSYKIEITPLETLETYGTTVDVSKFAKLSGFPNITRELDQGDFEIGVFNYGSFSIMFKNESGKFNDPEMDGRTIFPLKRDKAKLLLTFTDNNNNDTISYRGLLTDSATRQDVNNREISLTFLSYDSIFSKIDVDPGAILNGMSFSKVFEILLTNKKITDLLTYSSVNINPLLDLTIDKGSSFDPLTIKAAIDKLLIASNSVLLIDDSLNIIVRSRIENSNTPHELFLNDQFKRDNIISIRGYNNGKQRMFNSIVINGIKKRDTISIKENDTTQQSFTLDFITDIDKAETITQSILNTFGLPKKELLISIDKEELTDLNMLDKVILDINLELHIKNSSAPLYEYAEYDKGYEYPIEISDFKIYPSDIFKVIGITEQPSTFNNILKLRQI